jgi:hypothetical protein
MKALAVSLKQHTSEGDPEVGGPSQIAILKNGRIDSIEQPSFPPIDPTGFNFQIVATITVDNSATPGRPTSYGILTSGLFGVYFNDTFIHVRQRLDDAYYANNEFKDSVLFYGGGRTIFAKTNRVTDCDLEIGPNVSRDSPEVKELLKNFVWRSVSPISSSGTPKK